MPKKESITAKLANRWQLPLALLIVFAVVICFWKALLYLVVFSGAWVAASFLSLRAKQSKALSLGGGFVAALLAVFALSAVLGSSSTAISASSEPVATATAKAPSRPESHLSEVLAEKTLLEKALENKANAIAWRVTTLQPKVFHYIIYAYERNGDGTVNCIGTDKRLLVVAPPFVIADYPMGKTIRQPE